MPASAAILKTSCGFFKENHVARKAYVIDCCFGRFFACSVKLIESLVSSAIVKAAYVEYA